MNVTIREMHRDDVDNVYRLECLIFNDAWSYKNFLSETDGSYHKKPFVLEVNGVLAGYTFIWIIADEIHINNIAINPDFQRKGLGLKLIRFIFDKFKDYNKFLLEVRKSNKAAIRLYQKCGFEVLYIRSKYYSDGEDALVMLKKLNIEQV